MWSGCNHIVYWSLQQLASCSSFANYYIKFFFQDVFVCEYQMSKEPLSFSPFPLVFGRQWLGVGRNRIESHFSFFKQEQYTCNKWFFYGLTLSKETALLCLETQQQIMCYQKDIVPPCTYFFCQSNVPDRIWRLINGTINIIGLELKWPVS